MKKLLFLLLLCSFISHVNCFVGTSNINETEEFYNWTDGNNNGDNSPNSYSSDDEYDQLVNEFRCGSIADEVYNNCMQEPLITPQECSDRKDEIYNQCMEDPDRFLLEYSINN